MAGLLKYAPKVMSGICRNGQAMKDAILPGSLVLFKVAGSRLYNHGAIVTSWPKGIHAVHPKVMESDLAIHAMTGHTQIAVFDPWETADVER